MLDEPLLELVFVLNSEVMLDDAPLVLVVVWPPVRRARPAFKLEISLVRYGGAVQLRQSRRGVGQEHHRIRRRELAEAGGDALLAHGLGEGAFDVIDLLGRGHGRPQRAQGQGGQGAQQRHRLSTARSPHPCLAARALSRSPAN